MDCARTVFPPSPATREMLMDDNVQNVSMGNVEALKEAVQSAAEGDISMLPPVAGVEESKQDSDGDEEYDDEEDGDGSDIDSQDQVESPERPKRKRNPAPSRQAPAPEPKPVQPLGERKRFHETGAEALAGVTFPLQVSASVTIESLGSCEPKHYCNRGSLFPVGFKSTCIFSSYKTADTKVKYTSEIVDHEGKPKFVVTAEDDVGNPVSEPSATATWKVILERVKSINGRDGSRHAMSGPRQFGYSLPAVIALMQGLPGAMDCKRYIFQDVKFELKVKTPKVSPSTQRKKARTTPEPNIAQFASPVSSITNTSTTAAPAADGSVPAGATASTGGETTADVPVAAAPAVPALPDPRLAGFEAQLSAVIEESRLAFEQPSDSNMLGSVFFNHEATAAELAAFKAAYPTDMPKIPVESLKLLAKLIHGSSFPVSALAEGVSQVLGIRVGELPTQIEAMGRRKAYGVREGRCNVNEDDSKLALWRYEVLSENESLLAPCKVDRDLNTRLKDNASRVRTLQTIVQLLSAPVVDETKLAAQEAQLAALSRKEEERKQKVAAAAQAAREKEALREKKAAERELMKAAAKAEKEKHLEAKTAERAAKEQAKAAEKAAKQEAKAAEKSAKLDAKTAVKQAAKSSDEPADAATASAAPSGEETKDAAAATETSKEAKPRGRSSKAAQAVKGVPAITSFFGVKTPAAKPEPTTTTSADEVPDVELVVAPTRSYDDIFFQSEPAPPLCLAPRIAGTCRQNRVKLLQFSENRRPAYFGTFHKSLNGALVSGRNPLGQDTSVFDYEVESDDEWEEEDVDAESLSDTSVVDEEEKGEVDELDYNDGWLCRDEEVVMEAGVEQEDGDGDLTTEAAGTGGHRPAPTFAGFASNARKQLIVGPDRAAEELTQFSMELLAGVSGPFAAYVPPPEVAAEAAIKKVKPARAFPASALSVLVQIVNGSKRSMTEMVVEFFQTAHVSVTKKAVIKEIQRIAALGTTAGTKRVWSVHPQFLDAVGGVTSGAASASVPATLSPLKAEDVPDDADDEPMAAPA